MVDAYQILGISRTADLNEVKKAYRKLAKEHHPDYNPGNLKASVKFQEITEAYDAIVNSKTSLQIPEQNKPIRVVDVLITVNMVAAYLGAELPFEDRIIKIPVGFDVDGSYSVRFEKANEIVKVTCTFQYRDQENFTRSDLDLFTHMTIAQKDLKDQTVFPVLNHPNPQGQFIRFSNEVKDNDWTLFKGAGLPDEKGNKGDLHVKVSVPENKSSFVLLNIIKGLFLTVFWISVLWLIFK